jgi:hypothetical protein
MACFSIFIFNMPTEEGREMIQIITSNLRFIRHSLQPIVLLGDKIYGTLNSG